MKLRKDSSLLVIILLTYYIILLYYSMLITNKDESFRGFIGFYVQQIIQHVCTFVTQIY